MHWKMLYGDYVTRASELYPRICLIFPSPGLYQYPPLYVPCPPRRDPHELRIILKTLKLVASQAQPRPPQAPLGFCAELTKERRLPCSLLNCLKNYQQQGLRWLQYPWLDRLRGCTEGPRGYNN